MYPARLMLTRRAAAALRETVQRALTRASGEHFWNVGSTLATRAGTLLLYAAVVTHFINESSSAAFANASLLLLGYAYIQLLDLGIGYAVTQRFGRAVATGDPDAMQVLRAALPLYLGCAAIASVTLFAAATPISQIMFGADTYSGAVRTLAFGVWALFLSSYFSAILQARNKVTWINLSRFLLEVCKAVAFVVAVGAQRPVHVIVTVTVIGTFARALVDMALAARLLGTLSFLRLRFSRSELSRNLTLGWPMLVALLLGIVNTLVDRLFVSRAFGAEALAHYTIAYEVNAKAFFLVGAISAALYTPILRRAATGKSQRLLLLISLGSVALVGACYFLPLMVLAEPLLSWWINPELGRAVTTATRFAAVMGVVYLSMSVLFNMLQASGRSLLVMNGTVVASAVIVGGLALMPREWNVEGVIAIVTLGFFAQMLVYVIGLRKA